jgi:hypothetical protein
VEVSKQLTDRPLVVSSNYCTVLPPILFLFYLYKMNLLYPFLASSSLTLTHSFTADHDTLDIYIHTVIVGKSIDADELAAYRSSNRSGTSSETILEWAKRIVIFGSSIVGGVVIIFGIGRLSAGLGGKDGTTNGSSSSSTSSRKSLE